MSSHPWLRLDVDNPISLKSKHVGMALNALNMETGFPIPFFLVHVRKTKELLSKYGVQRTWFFRDFTCPDDFDESFGVHITSPDTAVDDIRTVRKKLGDFSLLWGKNEQGKTLTIDALIKLLLGKNVGEFRRIDRVDEYPYGYAVIEDNEGQEVKVPESGSLTSVAGLSISECRNVFIIRDSELAIEKDEKQAQKWIDEKLKELKFYPKNYR